MKKTFILDTNVILHDPECIFKFDKHDVLIPFVVMEELDAFKTAKSDIGHNARRFVRTLDRLGVQDLVGGISLGLDKGYLRVVQDGAPIA